MSIVWLVAALLPMVLSSWGAIVWSTMTGPALQYKFDAISPCFTGGYTLARCVSRSALIQLRGLGQGRETMFGSSSAI